MTWLINFWTGIRHLPYVHWKYDQFFLNNSIFTHTHTRGVNFFKNICNFLQFLFFGQWCCYYLTFCFCSIFILFFFMWNFHFAFLFYFQIMWEFFLPICLISLHRKYHLVNDFKNSFQAHWKLSQKWNNAHSLV